jgi:hypothetical protein
MTTSNVSFVKSVDVNVCGGCFSPRVAPQEELRVFLDRELTAFNNSEPAGSGRAPHLFYLVKGRKQVNIGRRLLEPAVARNDSDLLSVRRQVEYRNKRRYEVTYRPWVRPISKLEAVDLLDPSKRTAFYGLEVSIPMPDGGIEHVVQKIQAAPVVPHLGVHIAPDGAFHLRYFLSQSSNNFELKLLVEQAITANLGGNANNVGEGTASLPVPGTKTFDATGHQTGAAELWTSDVSDFYSLEGVHELFMELEEEA